MTAEINDTAASDNARTAQLGRDLAKHILAMENDAYLTGYPEWDTIYVEAKLLLDTQEAQS